MSIIGLNASFRKKRDYKKEIKAMAKIMGKDIMPEVKLSKKRKKRKKETAPRKRSEALLRNEVIKHLRSHGCVVKRLENAITGANQRGFPDLWVFYLKTQWAGWIECKGPTAIFYPEQIEFRSLCLSCNIKYLEVRKIEDVKEIYESIRII